MIAVDSSSLIRYFNGVDAPDTQLVDIALADRRLMLPPVVLTEVLSDPKLPVELESALGGIPLLELGDGYWTRRGELRRRVLSRGLKARLADTLIAAACIDHDLPLVNHDSDYRHFARVGGLKLLP